MIQGYKGNYSYNETTVSGWNSAEIGVYYCGYRLQNGSLFPLYVGKATSNIGIRGRLLQHLSEDKWPDVSRFGYCVCSTSGEAEDLEATELARLKPKYNTLGVSASF